jgi:hypothetical protein
MFVYLPVLILLIMPGGIFWLISFHMLNTVTVWDVHSLKKPKQRVWDSATHDMNHFTIVASSSILQMLTCRTEKERNFSKPYLWNSGKLLRHNTVLSPKNWNASLMILIDVNVRGVRELQFIFHNLHDNSYIWYQKSFDT